LLLAPAASDYSGLAGVLLGKTSVDWLSNGFVAAVPKALQQFWQILIQPLSWVAAPE
jgi:hypothetical protein